MKDILISGYYGFKNSGDDALLSCIIDDICKCFDRSKIVVLSANPEETSRIYKVRAADRMNILSVASHMTKAEMLISGGGTLIQDGTSTKSLMYYLGIIAAAQFFGLKTMLYANGIGPLTHETNKKITRHILRKVDMITLRDMRSREVLNQIGITENIHVTADPVFGIKNIDKDRGAEILLEHGVPRGACCIGISVRGRKNCSDAYTAELAKAVDAASSKYNLFPVLIPMQKNKDEAACESLKNSLHCKSIILDSDMNVNSIIAVTSNMKLCIGMRLHMLIYAAVACIPVIGLVYDPKVSGFMQYANQQFYMDVDSITKEKLLPVIDNVMNNYDAIKEEVRQTNERMRNISKDNIKYLKETAERKKRQ